MNQEKILEQFHYFNTHADVDSVYGNWAVSTDGDVVNYLYPYAILAIHFKDADWMEMKKTKVWFKKEIIRIKKNVSDNVRGNRCSSIKHKRVQ